VGGQKARPRFDAAPLGFILVMNSFQICTCVIYRTERFVRGPFLFEI